MPVATRRKAQEADLTLENDPEATLRKKPMRRPAAAKTAKTTSEIKPATIRNRKNPTQTNVEEGEEETTRATQQPKKRPVKATRNTKAADPEAELAEATEPTKVTRSTRTGSIRASKAAINTSSTPTLLPTTASKPIRQTRVAVSKPAPLSPKKVTQVTRVQTRQGKSSDKPAGKKIAPVKAQLPAKALLRRRNVSDENADVPEQTPSTATADSESEEDEIQVVASSSVHISPRRTRGAPQKKRVSSEASMSSAATTPMESPVQSPTHTDTEEAGEQAGESMQEDSASDEDERRENDSEDELNGPKTPMRRCSPGAAARYQASARNTIRRLNAQQRSPIQYSATPKALFQTVSSPKSMAIAFEDIEESVTEQEAEADPSDDEPSFLPDDGIINLDADVDSTTTPRTQWAGHLLSPPVSDGRGSEATTIVLGPGTLDEHVGSTASGDEDSCVSSNDTVCIHTQDLGEQLTAPLLSLDETISAEMDPFDTSSPIDDALRMLETTDEGLSPIESGDHIREPETLVWNNIREDQTISVDFDAHLSNIRALPQVDQTERLSLSGSPFHNIVSQSPAAETSAACGVQSPASDLSARRLTFNLNDLVDVSALTEPTQRLDLSGVRFGSSVTASTRKSKNDGDELTSMDWTNDQDQTEPERMDVDNEMSKEPQLETLEHLEQSNINLPHYARPTFAFDARRKSLPALLVQTPVKAGMRPHTSDGASISRVRNHLSAWLRPTSNLPLFAPSTPTRARSSTSHGSTTAQSSVKRKSGVFRTAVTPVRAVDERRPRYAPRETYEEHAKTVAAPTRFRSPVQTKTNRRMTIHKLVGSARAVGFEKEEAEQDTVNVQSPAAATLATPRERRPRFAPQENYVDHPMTIAAPQRFKLHSKLRSSRRETIHQIVHEEAQRALVQDVEQSEQENDSPKPEQTPVTTPKERYPRLRPRNDYEDHAKTVAGPVRFQTPIKSPAPRPATARKGDSLHKTALKAHAARESHTPIKTPLRAAAMTPSQEPMTPHPAAPLRGVVALVEVFTLDGASACGPFVALLRRLGAKTTQSWSERVTHVVFKDGSPTTLQRVRLHNKAAEESGQGTYVHCVNSRWVSNCDQEGERKDESDEAYVVDVTEVPRGGKRRRKSMEPSALVNLNGSVVRDRKSSLGRSSLSRAALKFDSPAKRGSDQTVIASPSGCFSTPKVAASETECGEDSPMTPAWIAAPDQLVQQTAPINRIRKLKLSGNEEAKSRRLTFWNGGSA